MIQKEMSPVTPAQLLTVILTLALLLSIYVSAADFQHVKHIATDGKKGQAYVDSIRNLNKYSRSFQKYTVATYHYTVRLQNGTTRQFTRTDKIKQDTQAALREKTEVAIFYLPENPQEAILALEVFDTPLDYLGLIGMPLGLIVSIILLFNINIFLKNDRRFQKWLETQKTP